MSAFPLALKSWRDLLPLIASAMLASVLAGCAATTGLSDMSANVTSIGGLFGPSGTPRSILAFVVSTRKDGGAGTNEMRPDGPEYSLQILSVPPNHRAGQIERPAWGAADPARHFTVATERQLDEQSFRNELATNISGRIGSNRDVLLYVHGFNTSYDDARFRLAQIVQDARFGGVPVLFTWPSSNNLLSYEGARESATASRDALAQLLQDLSDVPDIGQIHILAHSMGTWLAMEALRERAIAGSPSLNGKLGMVMLAAPDIDLSVFRAQLAKLDASHVSILVSANDRALSLSETLTGDRPRVGALDPRKAADRVALAHLGVKVYDLSGKSGGLIGHDAYADAPDVIRSIGTQIGRRRVQDEDVQAVLGEKPVSSDVSAAPLPQPASGSTPTGTPVSATTPANISAPPGTPASGTARAGTSSSAAALPETMQAGAPPLPPATNVGPPPGAGSGPPGSAGLSTTAATPAY